VDAIAVQVAFYLRTPPRDPARLNRQSHLREDPETDYPKDRDQARKGDAPEVAA
jgi:hypothetical protein